MNASDLLKSCRIVPVVVIDDLETAVPLAETLLSAGLTAIEVTLRTPVGIAAIESIANAVPDMIVGAGSVRETSQIKAVRDAGARFAVSPGSSPALLDAAEYDNMPFIPGAVTPTETLCLLERGYSLQKLFPAEVVGGTKYLQAIGGPIPDAIFMPTGGVNADNVANYLALDNVACVGGTWIAPKSLLADRDFAAIKSLAVEAANF
jgi:2-dehydro-3-deoxyphosphogluconate aldolase/(4S)-4-hydroxy-2-oxoglutarate aldolase